MKNILALKIVDNSQVAEARRLTSYAVTSMGLNENQVGKISIVVTELTNNLVKHVKSGGEFHLHKIITPQYEAVELVTIDKGPGMRNIAECMRDGYSTAGSPGTGLGSINRMSDFFDIYSVVGQGTVVLSRVLLKKNPVSVMEDFFETSAILMPKPHEEVSGDKWFSIQNGTRALILAADGLGHGIDASYAATEAVKGFQSNWNLPIDIIMQNLHERLLHTRGAAVSICEIDAKTNSVKYCGVGNIAASLITPEGVKSMISYNGTVGHEIRKIQVMNYKWSDNSLLIMHSDGLVTRWNMEKYPGLYYKPLTIICSLLYRDFSRGNDDVLVFGMRKQQKRVLHD